MWAESSVIILASIYLSLLSSAIPALIPVPTFYGFCSTAVIALKCEFKWGFPQNKKTLWSLSMLIQL